MAGKPFLSVVLIYRFLFKHVLQRIEAERAHSLALRALQVPARVPRMEQAVRRILTPSDGRLQVQALGKSFSSPLGVPAGVDKNAACFGALGALGFGFVEIGTVTAERQPGAARPRIRRLPEDRALLNWMGFPNDGAARTAERLRRRTGSTIVGANVGKSKATPMHAAGDDYRRSVRLLAPHADFLVLNVSSPNTPGLRDMQAPGQLGALVDAVKEELEQLDAALPLLVKLSPDLDDENVDAIADLALERQLDGIITVNTTLSRDGLTDPGAVAHLPGGISGAPVKARALEVLRRVYARTGDRLTLISVGGIETPQDAFERILAGATLVQGYTGFVYGGPLWPRNINRGLSELVAASGAAGIQALVGAAARGTSTVVLAQPIP